MNHYRNNYVLEHTSICRSDDPGISKYDGLWIPTSFLGGPAAIDLFAIAHRGGTSQHIWGNGDRCPDAGVLNTATGTVLVRRPAAAVDRTFSDAVGDSVNGGQDLTSARFRTFGDQFEITLTFAAPINLESLSYRLSGWVVLDSDQDILSGMQAMGKTISTWGGDVLLHYYIAQISPQLQIFLSGFTGGEGVPFGPPTMSNFRGNDGRWYVNGNQLIIASSLAVLDAWDLSIQGTVNVMQRKPTTAKMIAGALTTNSSEISSDMMPSTGGNFFDLKAGQEKTPLAWNAASTISQTDPAEFGAISGMDLTQVDAETINARLVVKGTLSRWDMTEPQGRLSMERMPVLMSHHLHR